MTRWVVVPLLTVMFALGCNWLKAKERAPLQGGEQLEYQAYYNGARAQAVLTFEKKGGGFVIKSSSPGFPPQRVGPDLQDPVRPIAAFGLGRIWLPPSMREVGHKTYASEIVREEASEGRTIVVMRSTLLEHYFDKQTGFLLGMKGLSDNARLVRTTVDNLEVIKLPSLYKPVQGTTPAPGYRR